MTRSQLARRFLFAILIAAVLASVIHRLNASECDSDDPDSTCFIVYRPNICDSLEPWTYWWGFWGCENRMDLMAESVTYTELPNGLVLVEILREYPGGERSEIIRILKGRR